MVGYSGPRGRLVGQVGMCWHCRTYCVARQGVGDAEALQWGSGPEALRGAHGGVLVCWCQ